MPDSPTATALASVRGATRTCLNGWWDFQPAAESADFPTVVPTEGWSRDAILVPSFFTKPCDVTRRRGERLFRSDAAARPGPFPADTEFLLDAYGYPLEWTASLCGWHRRTLRFDAPSPTAADGRWHLVLEGVQPAAMPFLNGVRLPTHPHPSLPHRLDVTDLVRPGEDHELAVFCADYPRGKDGRALVPTGNRWTVGGHGGLWQDVWLERRGVVHVAAVDVRTQDGRVLVRWELANAGPVECEVTLAASLAPWRRGEEPAHAVRSRAFPPQTVRVPAGGHAEVFAEIADDGLARWSPRQPNLHWLRTRVYLASNGKHRTLETHVERFGVRDLRLDGRDLLLDSVPLHLFSDWGHKATPYHHTEAWIRQWFGMMRDANLNHTRLHTHPHPRLVLDLADEAGILVTVETGIHGSGGEQGADDPRYWEAARDHVRRLVARDRNHPSVLLWSVENEMRWNRNATDLTRRELPALRRLFQELDPTRPAYHEGDTSMWDERGLAIISRHYGKECAGEGWWDGRQPLHCGEMSLHHLMGPNNTLHLAGDAVYADYAEVERAASEDARRIIEAGRSRGVLAWGPWNLSGIANLRPKTGWVRPTYEDWTAPGVKPLQVPPHGSELAFWRADGEPGHAPSPSFAGLRDAFRPLAVVDRSWRAQCRQGQTVRRILTVVNDADRDLAGVLAINLGPVRVATREQIRVTRGGTTEIPVEFTVPADLTPGHHDYVVLFAASTGECDAWSRRWRVAAPFAGARPLAGLSVCTVGPRAPVAELRALGADVSPVATLAEAGGHAVIVVGQNALQGDDEDGERLLALTANGARILLLEQSRSVFPALPLRPQPLATAWRRSPDHPLVHGVADDDLRFWGEAGYAAVDGDHLVTKAPFRKGEGRHALAVVDAGEGGFGTGDLGAQALLEIEEGNGLLVASQLLLTGRFADLPVAETLLVNAVRRLHAWTPPAAGSVLVVDAGSPPGPAVAAARAGAQVLVEGFNDAAGAAKLPAWSRAIGVELTWEPELDQHWQAVRPATGQGMDPLLAGISHEDLCGIETWTYARPEAVNHALADGAFVPAPGLEPILVTATASALRELMVHGGKAELLRAHTVSRFVYGDERPPERVLLGRVRVGAGAVLLSALGFPPDHPRLGRARRRLLRNLGAAPAEGSSLRGERVAAGGARSEGFANVLHRATSATDEATWAAVAGATASGLHDMFWNQPWLDHGEWERLPAASPAVLADGWLDAFAGWEPGQPVLVGTTVVSPRARKDLSSDVGVPNPEEQVFCDLQGTGRAEAVLNGRRLEGVTFHGGRAALADLELEAGRNHFVLRWWPAATGDRLRLDFRDIMRRPEVELLFV